MVPKNNLSENQGRRQMLSNAGVVAIAVAGGLFVLGMVRIAMVSGDGRAPQFTHLVLKLADRTSEWFGLPKGGILISGPLVWGSISGLIALIFQILKTIIRD